MDQGDDLSGDPSVAYDSIRNRFIVAYQSNALTGNAQANMFARVFDVTTESFVTSPVKIHPADGVDKGWIVRGRGDYFHVSFSQPGGNVVKYSRSEDGGISWPKQGEARSGGAITSLFAPQMGSPRFRGPLFLCAPNSTEGARLWRNDGQFGMAAPENIQFEELTEDDLMMSQLSTPFAGANVSENNALLNSSAYPYLIADNSTPNRLYLVYFQANVFGAFDVNCVAFSRDPNTDLWTKSSPVRVNDNPIDDGTDQFCPAAITDAKGRVHVIFYDGRAYSGASPDACDPMAGPISRYDVYYALSVDGGATFANYQVPTITEEPVICGSLVGDNKFPGEYCGIDVSGDRVWLAFAGTCQNDPGDQKTVIWGTTVDL